MRRTQSLLAILVSCCSFQIMMPQVPAVNPAEGSPSESPFIDGRFVWTVSEPLVKPARRPNDSYYSIKDPTVVRFEG